MSRIGRCWGICGMKPDIIIGIGWWRARNGWTVFASCSAMSGKTTRRLFRVHYQQGPPANWGEKFVSAYASSHPWEDWAETWAHYLHMTETLDTASSFNLDIESVEMPFEGFRPDVLLQPDDEFLHFINSWGRFTAVLNELSLSMGLPDFYPFVLSKSSVAKLHFVHRLIEDQRP